MFLRYSSVTNRQRTLHNRARLDRVRNPQALSIALQWIQKSFFSNNTYKNVRILRNKKSEFRFTQNYFHCVSQPLSGASRTDSETRTKKVVSSIPSKVNVVYFIILHGTLGIPSAVGFQGSVLRRFRSFCPTVCHVVVR